MALINTNNKNLNRLIGFAILIIFHTVFNYWNNKKLETAGGYNTEVIGIITNKMNRRYNRNSMDFTYQFQNKTYSNFQRNIDDEYYQLLSIGDDIRILINDKYPKCAKLKLN